MWGNPKSRSQEGYYLLLYVQKKQSSHRNRWGHNESITSIWLYSFNAKQRNMVLLSDLLILCSIMQCAQRTILFPWTTRACLKKKKKKYQEHLTFTNQSLCEDMLTQRMQTLRHLRMKCWEEYLDWWGIMIGWISTHMRSVCRDSEQFK
jgi:hypothetical protein